jgi:TPR repeat protein
MGYGNGEDVLCGADSKTAYMYYRKAAKLEHPQALAKAGDFLYSGKGTPYGKKAKTEAF